MTAHPRNVYCKGFSDGLNPETKPSITEWTNTHRRIPVDAAERGGQIMDTSRTPWVDEIANCLEPSSTYNYIDVMKGAQLAISTLGENFVGTTIYNKAGKIQYVMPTTDGAKTVSNEKISPMINDCPILSNRVASATSRTKSNTIYEKEFIGGRLKLAGAHSPTGLRQGSYGKIIVDEADAMEVTSEGCPLVILEKRANTFGKKFKFFVFSTALLEGLSRVDERFKKGDQRYFNIPCPHCNYYQVLDFARFNKVPGNVYMTCANLDCKKEIREEHKSFFLSRGKWIKTYHQVKAKIDFKYGIEDFKKDFLYLVKFKDLTKLIEDGKVSDVRQTRASFHISSLYSPLGWYSWTQAVTEYLEAEGKPEKMQVFVNTVLGLPWKDHIQYAKTEDLLDTREDYFEKDSKYEVPRRATTLTMAVDTQNDRLEALVVGWGLTEDGKALERWVIDKEIFWGDPAEKAVWNQVDEFRKRSYLAEDNSVRQIAIVGVDSGGQRTQFVYDFCRIRQGVLALKGGAGENHPIARHYSTIKTEHGHDVKLHFVGTHTCKSRIFTILSKSYEGLEKIHFPKNEWCNKDFFDQLTAEKLITKYYKGAPYREWTKIRPRNEVLDLMVYNHGLLYYLSADPYRYLKAEADKYAIQIFTTPTPNKNIAIKKAKKTMKRSNLL